MTRPLPWIAALCLTAGLSACNAPIVPATTAPAPPWPRPDNVPELVRAAGLRGLPTEHIDYHIHTLLKVYYQGADVTVPANIGIQPGEGLSPLHTHDTSGIVHVENQTKEDFTIGQFFTEWGVPLKGAKAWLDGKEVTGPVDAVVLVDQKVLVVSYGPPPNPIPTVYAVPTPKPATP